MWYAEICEPGAQIFCPICGTNNIQTEPDFKLTDCKHLESITTSLAFGEFEIDKNDIFQEVFSKYDADHSLEIAEFVDEITGQFRATLLDDIIENPTRGQINSANNRIATKLRKSKEKKVRGGNRKSS